MATGKVDHSRVEEILAMLKQGGCSHAANLLGDSEHIDMFSMDRAVYTTTFGPTIGDTV
jgi:hypothetical protein